MLAAVEDGRERAAWTWILEHMEAYPTGPTVRRLQPLRPPTRPEKGRRMVAAHFVTAPDPEGGVPVPTALLWTAGMMPKRVVLDLESGAAEKVAAALFTDTHRGALIAFPDGAVQAFAVMLRRYARTWVRLGYTIEPLVAGAAIKALLIRRARHSWALCDLDTMTGLKGFTEATFVATFGTASPSPVTALHSALVGWQKMSLEHFDAAAGVTVGRSAIRAAARNLGEQSWLWRPLPLAVAMLRSGGGYRGGYAVARRYTGPAWAMDLNKAYLWALGEPMPLRAGVTTALGGHDAPPGAYLSRVEGSGLAPLFLGVWREDGGGFDRVVWHGGDALAVLTMTETAAVRRLGYRVTVGRGIVYGSTFTLRGFVAQVAGITRMYGRGSAQERIAKAYGNTVYGKLAERPDREQVMYALDSPGEGWSAYVDNTGTEIADLWAKRGVAYRSHQHIDAASEVTANVRARLYDAIGTVVRAGGEVPQADTDGFLSSIDPSGLFDTDLTAPGAWRPAQGPQRAIVWGRRGYAFGEDVHAAGLSGVSAAMADQAMAGEAVGVNMQVRAGAFGSGPLYQSTRRMVRAV